MRHAIFPQWQCAQALLLSPLFILCSLQLFLLLPSSPTTTTISIPSVLASSFNEPHSHRGVVTPFQPGDPNVSLDTKAKSILHQGKPYQTQIQSGDSGRGLVVQDIDAPPSIVWGRILDYDNYSSMVPKTVESKNYNIIHHKQKNDALTQTIYTRMKVGFPLLKLEFFIKHLYYPSLNSLTWTLDYDKLSDFNDSCGYWYVIPHPDNGNSNGNERTRVYYSVEVSMFDWVPKFVVDFMSTKALTDATAWVKKYSELEYAKQKKLKQEQQQKQELLDNMNQVLVVDQQPKKKKGLFGGIFRNKKKEALELQKIQEERLRLQKLQEEEEEKRRKEMEEAKKILRLTWLRLGLVSIVTILVIYDFHLWISG